MARMRSFAAIFIAAITLPASAALARGCHFGDDGFASVTCCSPAQPNLPQFPRFQVSGQYACFQNCDSRPFKLRFW